MILFYRQKRYSILGFFSELEIAVTCSSYELICNRHMQCFLLAEKLFYIVFLHRTWNRNLHCETQLWRPHTNLHLGRIQSTEHLTQHIIQSSSAAKASSKQHRFLFLHCLLGSIADNHPRTNFDVLPSLDMITRRSPIFPWKSENTLTIKKELHHSEQ